MSDAVTPVRVLLLAVLIIAGGVAIYGLAVAKSVPMIVSGMAIVGVCLFLLGLIAAGAVVRAGRRGQGALAFTAAVFGGLCMLGAAGSLSVAIVLGLLAASA
jgi:hypothetical protein